MGCVKKAVALLICILLAMNAAACGATPPITSANTTECATSMATIMPAATTQPTPSLLPTIETMPEPTEEATPTSEPTAPAIPQSVLEYPALNELSIYKQNGMTKEQADALSILLGGAYGMRSFKNIRELKQNDFLRFSFNIFRFFPDFVLGEGFYDIPTDNEMYRPIQRKDVEKVINSAFGKNYRSKYIGSADDGIIYANGKYKVNYDGCMHPYTPVLFNIQKLDSNRFSCKMDIIEYGCDGIYYNGKAQAVVQKDSNSIFGYRMISCQPFPSVLPKFPDIMASSFLPAEDEWGNGPKNVLDDDSMTVWRAKGDPLWIMLSSDEMQTITGMIVSYWADIPDNAFYTIELSDGSHYVCQDYVVSFEKPVKTKSIKITFYGTPSVSVDTVLPY